MTRNGKGRMLWAIVNELRFRHPLPWIVNKDSLDEVFAEVVAKDGTVLARMLLSSEAMYLVRIAQELDRLDTELIDQIGAATVEITRV